MKLTNLLAAAAALSLITAAGVSAQPTEDCDAVGATETTDDDCPPIGIDPTVAALGAAGAAIGIIAIIGDDGGSTTTSTGGT